VKNVEILESVGSVAEVKYAPNFNEIRNRYPDRIPEIIKAVKTGKFELRAEDALLEINGTQESFDAEIILVTYQAKAGQHVASEKGVVVSLDLTLTDELKDEGFARDIVRAVQDARRQMDCAITDEITVEFVGSVPEAWVDYICGETLSNRAEIADADLTLEIAGDDDRAVTVKVKK
jgi:isoleucyl-tRNA synthetase